MKIHTRSLIVMGATVFILFFFMNLLAQVSIFSSYDQVEQFESRTNVMRVIDSINFELDKLGETTRAWAVWDETSRYMQDANPDYNRSNLDPAASYESLGVNGIIFYDSEGDLYTSRWFDPATRTVSNAPERVTEHLLRYRGVVNASEGVWGKTGLISTPSGLFMVSSHRIINNSGAANGGGTLVMIREYSPVWISGLEDRTHLNFRFIPIEDPSVEKEWKDLLISQPLGSPVLSRATGSDIIEGYAVLRDIDNSPIIILNVHTPRFLHEQVIATMVFLICSLLVIGAVYIVMVEFLMQRYVLAPLTGLDASIKRISEEQDLSARLPVSGDDEVSSIKNSFNLLLEEVEDRERELRESREQLGEANRRANLYLDIYLDVMSYEIFNSTVSILGYADLITENGGEKEKEYAEKIQAISRRDRGVIRNIGIISRIYKNPPTIGPIDPDPVVQAVIENNPGTEVSYSGPGRYVLADGMLRQVFENLIENAIKFRNGPARIDITAEARDEGTVLFCVTDHGKGIPDVLKETIFDRFRPGSGDRSSYGLGLHIVKMLVEAYGGRIWAQDRVPGRPEQGAVICFTLKRAT
jgi:signal transduction histidine kinase